MKISEIAKLVPRLGSYDRDIESWADEFTRIMELSDINEPKKVFAWAKENVPGRLKGILEDLVTNDDEEYMNIYPDVAAIKNAIEIVLEITPQEKCSNLKALKIKNGESIKDFNWRYNKLYKSLTPEGQAFITFKDYTNSIMSRAYARKEVITSQPQNLNSAFRIAELAETASEVPTRNRNVVMLTSNFGINNSIFSNRYKRYNNGFNNNFNNYNNYNNNYNNGNFNNRYYRNDDYNNFYNNSNNDNFSANNYHDNSDMNFSQTNYNKNNNYNNNYNKVNNNFNNNKNNYNNPRCNRNNNICFKYNQLGHRMQN